MTGPFTVEINRVQALGSAFASVVNDLLAAEVAKSGLRQYQLAISFKEDTADGGVDAALQSTVAGDWLPDGDSVWQFKSADRSPAECAAEVRKDEVKTRIMAGATYVMVIGEPLTPRKTANRIKAMVEEIKAWDWNGALPNLKVRLYDANDLARWLSTFPALAIDKRLGAPGLSVLDFSRWRETDAFDESWQTMLSREAVGNGVVACLGGATPRLRVEGDNGIGKTRLVMEAVGASPMVELAAYVPSGDEVSTELLAYLMDGDRSSVLITDNCTRATHNSIRERITAEKVRLITMGPPDIPIVQDPVLRIDAATVDEIALLIQANVPEAWDELRPLVAENSFGNPRAALLLARNLAAAGQASVADVLQQDGFAGLLQAYLPENADFFLVAALALFDRVGWDREVRGQLDLIADFMGVDVRTLDPLGRQLEAAGLLSRAGRYRSVGPHPVAVFLAARFWESRSADVVSQLLPRLDHEMAKAFFERCADLGRYGPVQPVLHALMSSDGPFGSLEVIEESGTADFLSALAIVDPIRAARHIADLLERVELDSLRAMVHSRRGVVNALEKLGWHDETFELAADSLLRLSEAENEHYANNATGTWIALFSAVLPSTSAPPEHRLDYLTAISESTSPAVRALTARAASEALGDRGIRIVSAELQGGTVVAPRGSVQRGTEAVWYLNSMISILETLAEDPDDGVRTVATEALIDAIPRLLDVPTVGEHLASLAVQLTDEHLRTLRQRLELLGGMERAGGRASAARALLAQLPVRSDPDQLIAALATSSWEYDAESTRLDDLRALVRRGVDDGWLRQFVLDLPTDTALPSTFHLGKLLAGEANANDWLRLLTLVAERGDRAGLVGFLRARVDAGDDAAFDTAFEAGYLDALSISARLSILVSGPPSPAAVERARTLIPEVPPREAAWAVLRWRDALPPATIEATFDRWVAAISDDSGYLELLDWLSMLLHTGGSGVLPPSVRVRLVDVLEMRPLTRAAGQQTYRWCVEAAAAAHDDPVAVANVLMDQLVNGSVMIEESQEANVLRAACERDPEGVWTAVHTRVEAGQWRIQLATQGWLLRSVPMSMLMDWVGTSVQRARLVAGLAPMRERSEDELRPPAVDRPHPLAVALVERFPGNDDIAGALVAEMESGSWVGEYSGRIRYQIEQLTGWADDRSLPQEFRKLARRVRDSKERELVARLEHEAERRW